MGSMLSSNTDIMIVSPVHLLKLGPEVFPRPIVAIVLTITLGHHNAHLMQHTIPLDHSSHYDPTCK